MTEANKIDANGQIKVEYHMCVWNEPIMSSSLSQSCLENEDVRKFGIGKMNKVIL